MVTEGRMRLLRRAVDRGVPNAQFDLGIIYEHGEGVPEDFAEEARRLYPRLYS
jgi:TPR repeat protein